MNKLSIITTFLGSARDSYRSDSPDREIEARLEMAAQIPGCAGVELCYPADFSAPQSLKRSLEKYNLGVSALNFRSRRTGRWLRGSITSQDSAERQGAVDDLKRAMDFAAALGCNRITSCPLIDGVAVPFETDFEAMWDFAAQSLEAACHHNPGVKISLEYKKSAPSAQAMFGSAGEVASFCQHTGLDNLGATLDIGQSLLARERPSQSAVILAKTRRLFYVHLNDTAGFWDWDMLPATSHLWEFVELFYTLGKLGYDGDWYAFDVLSKKFDQLETFKIVMEMTRSLESITERLDPVEVENLIIEQNPAKSVQYLYSLV